MEGAGAERVNELMNLTLSLNKGNAWVGAATHSYSLKYHVQEKKKPGKNRYTWHRMVGNKLQWHLPVWSSCSSQHILASSCCSLLCFVLASSCVFFVCSFTLSPPSCLASFLLLTFRSLRNILPPGSPPWPPQAESGTFSANLHSTLGYAIKVGGKGERTSSNQEYNKIKLSVVPGTVLSILSPAWCHFPLFSFLSTPHGHTWPPSSSTHAPGLHQSANLYNLPPNVMVKTTAFMISQFL